MPSPRRIKVLLIAVVAFVVVLLMWTSQLRQSREADTRTIQDFYHKTVNAMDGANNGRQGKQEGRISPDKDGDGDVDGDDEKLAREMADRLKAAEQKAKDLANAKSPNKPDAPEKVIGVGSAASGQDKQQADAGSVGISAAGDSDSKGGPEKIQDVAAILDDMLKRSPVVIFSKTYCQYSKRAKGILLEKYAIEPAPYVVELDIHPLGSQIQARLAEMTGRRTVPNIMIKGKSIGGSDDISELDNQHLLVEKIESLTDKRVYVKERFVGNEQG